MKYKPIEPALFQKNRKKLARKLDKKSVAIIHSSDEMPRNGDQFFNYRQSSDFFYFSGIEQEKSVLVLCPDHPNKELREILYMFNVCMCYHNYGPEYNANYPIFLGRDRVNVVIEFINDELDNNNDLSFESESSN